MKTLLPILLSLVALVILIVVIAYADGASLPVNHSASVSGVVNAAPDKVFARITDIANGPAWRPQVKSVDVLPPDEGRDHWVENLGHGTKMDFLATRTETPIRRDVLLQDPGTAYGGTWTYELSPGPEANTTALKITETGFIKPPLYRFVMHHVMGITANLDTYLKNMQNSFKG